MDPGCKAGWGSGSESALQAQAPPKVRVTKPMLAMDLGKPSFVLDLRHVSNTVNQSPHIRGKHLVWAWNNSEVPHCSIGLRFVDVSSTSKPRNGRMHGTR